jgi:flagellar protein FliS
MSSEAQRAYVAVDLHTASPQRLRLMLIDAAITCVARTQDDALASQWANAGESFSEARRAVIELLAGVKSDAACGESEAALARKVRSLYVYLFRLLAEAQLYRDPGRITDALTLLATERETWRQVCERTGEIDDRPGRANPEVAASVSFQA